MNSLAIPWTATSYLWQSITTKIAHPGPNVSIGARVVNHSTLGKNSKVGFNATLFRSAVGDNVNIGHSSTVSHSSLEDHVLLYHRCLLHDVQVGRFSYISFDSQVLETKVGRFCSVGPHLICGIGLHPVDFASTSPVFYSTLRQCGTTFADRDHFREREEIVIGHDVWIGSRVFIRDGVTIGNGAIIAAGAVVVDNVPDYAIVGGVPAKIIRFRFPERTISDLLEIQWWNWSTDRLRKLQPLFAQNNIELFLEGARKQYR
jgi:acetyltransferase-like isoleucine patch superfamily enzyme